MTLRDRLAGVFVTALELPPSSDVQHLRQWTDPEWDSMGHAALVTAIEGEFGVELDPDDVVAVDSFEAAVGVLERLGAA